MQRVHIIGGKNHGKTQLIVELVQELSGRGLRVGTIKHTHHEHELDTPGKDSHRHREAGAAAVGILSRTLSAVFLPIDPGASGPVDRYAPLARILADCDLVLVEGDTQAAAPRIEVWRAALGTPPLAERDPAILAVVTDDSLATATTVLARSDVPQLASWIREVAAGRLPAAPQDFGDSASKQVR
jgi:molybdopterin-guanine dinucleotide biosynthesis protein MobB